MIWFWCCTKERNDIFHTDICSALRTPPMPLLRYALPPRRHIIIEHAAPVLPSCPGFVYAENITYMFYFHALSIIWFFRGWRWRWVLPLFFFFHSSVRYRKLYMPCRRRWIQSARRLLTPRFLGRALPSGHMLFAIDETECPVLHACLLTNILSYT